MISLAHIRESVRRMPLKASHRQTINRLLDLYEERGSLRIQAHVRELGGTHVVRELSDLGILEFERGSSGSLSSFHLLPRALR